MPYRVTLHGPERASLINLRARAEARAVIESELDFALPAPSGPAAGTDDADIEDLVSRRQAAREAKDWATADSLRDELSALGVVVEDTPAGPIWRRA